MLQIGLFHQFCEIYPGTISKDKHADYRSQISAGED